MTDDEQDPTENLADALERFVGSQAVRLWKGYEENLASAVAELARLRRGLPRNGDIPLESWEVFARGFPNGLAGRYDDPSPGELAAATSLSLYAFHQQSRRTRSMHRAGRDHSLGRAARALSLKSGSAGVESRIQALVRATSFNGVVEQMRSLVTQFRAHEIPLDYGGLARDLRAVHYADGLRGVRIRWSRDYYRFVPEPTDTSGAAPTDPTPEETA